MADWKSGIRRVIYPAYESRMLRRLPTESLPKHVGVMLDGNRRWARAVGADTAHGHRAGAANIEPLLGWCEEVGIQHVTLWLLSTDNLNRPSEELTPLLGIIEEAVASLADEQRWRLHPVGALDLLPQSTAAKLKAAAEATRDVDGIMVNVAVGYGGRREITDAVRALLHEQSSKGVTLEELAEVIDVEHSAPISTPGVSQPDLVIRTSGKKRHGGSAVAEHAQQFYFCEAYGRTFAAGLPARHPVRRAPRAPLRLLTSRWLVSSGHPRSGVSPPFVTKSGVLSRHGSGEVRRTRRPTRETSRLHCKAGSTLPRGRGPALRPAVDFPVHLCELGPERRVRAPTREG